MIADVWTLVIVIFVAQGFFNILALLMNREEDLKSARVIMIAMLGFIIWVMIEFLCIRHRIHIPLNFFYGTRYGSWLLLGPCTFLFFRAIIYQKELIWKDLFHFIPFVLLVLVIPFFSAQELSHRQIHYGMLAVFDHRPKTTTAFEYFYSTVFYIQFIHLLCYLLYNNHIIYNYKSRLKEQFSNLGHWIWLRAFNTLLIIALVSTCFFMYLIFFSQSYTRMLDYIYVLPFGILIYTIGLYLTKKRWSKAPEVKHMSDVTKNLDLEKLKNRLEYVMTSERPFLNPELRLQDLADLCNISKHELSYFLNQYMGVSFFDFINQKRVSQVKSDLLKSANDKTLLQIAFDAGFNNKTSFVNAFKKFEKCTPSQYRKREIDALV